MPELPEVETIKRDLEKELVGQKLRNIKIFNYSYFLKNKIRNLDSLLGTKLLYIKRKGKYLIFFFQKELLLFHLGLTGFFILSKRDINKFLDEKKKYLILVLEFEKYNLSYFDIRKFGKIKKVKVENISKLKEIKQLGKDVLKISFEEFKNIIKKRKRNIKSLLLDQKFIAGLGNIYIDELLFRAKVSPLKNTKDLKEEEIKELFYQMKKLLKEAIDLRGSSIRNYVNVNGEKGKFQEKHLVYRKKGLPCPKCGEILVYKKIAQRGTTYCPNCQSI